MRCLQFLTLLLAMVAMNGCSLFDLDRGHNARVEFRYADRTERAQKPALRITFTDPLDGQTLTRSDLADVGAASFSTATYGKLRVTAALFDEDDVATKGTVHLPLEADHQYSITVEIGEGNPARACFGCQGSKAFALDADLGYAPHDSLFIVWGGNSITDPVIY